MRNTGNKHKIINDPVHGFINISHGLIYSLVENPLVQRLRYIKQLGLTDYVYPGASHSRFQHSLGALHLMTLALDTLRQKGVEISDKEYESARSAILLHDIGHGPFSHALEFNLLSNISHEELSLALMKLLNTEYKGELDIAIEMFTGKYHREFFNDLISSQIDMDRLDYLVRDSFYSGVIEGSVGAGRIIKMLNVSNNRLVVDEKGIYSIEKFLIARRLMYWQVYMHKTVISAEKMLIRIIERVRQLNKAGHKIESSSAVDYFLRLSVTGRDPNLDEHADRALVDAFLHLDDNELISSMRLWSRSKDTILANLSSRLLSRDLFAIELTPLPFDVGSLATLGDLAEKRLGIGKDDAGYFVFGGEVSNRTYAPAAPSVRILTKTGNLKEITEVSDMLNHDALSREIKKYYLCFPKELRNIIQK